MYEVTELLGAGGMGEVYRAHDARLKRDVAIKTLAALGASDRDRVARFEREAETLAALNHPNIAQIYGVEEAGSSMAIVMELVGGVTLAELIARGPIALADALTIARQIADGLEAAHDHGVIHRDLKPANVKVRDDGTVKVLDFGLAKSLEPAPTASAPASPTITSPAMTKAGVILGTAAYMSPEQARGRTVDRRTDVWAFGCVLFEMLAGRRPFKAEDTVSDTVAAILRAEPEWTALPIGTPPKIRSLLERCLRKEVRRRLPHIAEARIEIEDATSDPRDTAPPVAESRRLYVWPAITALSLLLGAATAAWSLLRTPADASPVARFDVTAPPGATAFGVFGRTIEVGDPLSPDGKTIAFVSTVKGRQMIWVRPLESAAAHLLDRTDAADRPIWSADGRNIAYFAQGELKRIAVAGGPPMTIAATPGRDLAWNSDDVILIGGSNRPVHRVPASGGTPTPVTELAPGETTHDYPQFLPDNRHFLYIARRGPNTEDWSLYVGSVDSKERRHLEGIHAAARYSPTGHLLFLQDRNLMAQPFDVDRLALSGEAVSVVQGTADGPRALFSLSANGTLAFLTPIAEFESQLAWTDRTGVNVKPFTPRGVYNGVDLSPDGRYVAFDRGLDVLLFDIARNLTNSFVTRPGADLAPLFSADGTRIVFTSNFNSTSSSNNVNGGRLYERAIGAVAPERPLNSQAVGSMPTDWSADGHIAYTYANDIWALPPSTAGRTEPLQVTTTTFVEDGGTFSPDGRWIAYHSNDSAAGQDVYIQSFPDGSRRYPVSAGGGTVPRWSPDGKELFYVGPDFTLMAVPITHAGADLKIGTPARLFQSLALQGRRSYDVAPDGRFVLNLPVDQRPIQSLAVAVNWRSQLKR